MRLASSFLLGLALAISAATSAAPADSLDRLDQALKAVPAFEYGEDAAPLSVAEQIVVQAAKDPALRLEVSPPARTARQAGHPRRQGIPLPPTLYHRHRQVGAGP